MVVSHSITADRLVSTIATRLSEGFRLALVSAVEDDDRFRVAYVLLRAADDARVEFQVDVDKASPTIPTLARVDYGAGRFEREMRDLYGITPVDHPLPARLVRHGHWPQGWYPMLRSATEVPAFEPDVGSFPFVEVEGEGVYEIPVGPVHAGLIEPGHFRFSVVGETILRMKARLWFVHRGVEKLFEGRPPQDAIALAERISGDTAVGHALGFVLAVEDALGIDVPEPDRLMRALLLELERMYNHVAALGTLANDVGLGLVNAHAQRLREQLLRMNETVTGHRLLRGGISVGGARLRALPAAALIASVAAEAADLVQITLGNSTVLDRFTDTAILTEAAARDLGTLGYVARASGLGGDARRDHPMVDLGDRLSVPVENDGDVLARYLIRARELEVSAALIQDILGRLDGRAGRGDAKANGSAGIAGVGVGVVEGWRGTIVHRVELDASGQLTRVKVVDPSFFNWPALPVALAETIVPDFPLANASFGLSYAGNDL